MRVIGVTGTDGKTTTCMLAAAILSAAGHKVGTITTVSATISGLEIDTGLHTTTPDAPDMQRYLALMAASGMQYAIVEGTSEGLAQRRLDAVDFDVAAVTNITHEHLYYHKTWENYRDAKARLVRSLHSSYRKPRTAKVSILNADDNARGAFEYLLNIPVDEQIIYTRNGEIASLGGRKQTWIYSQEVRHTPSGLVFTLVTPYGEPPLESALLGEYNVSNILAAVGIALARRIPFDAIIEGVAQVRSVPGRMQVLQREPFTAIVDFAHTPNALERALETARALTRGRVIVVFGCAGLRDVDKRAWMGEVAGRLADRVVVTAEDPRTESLSEINRQITEGLKRSGRHEDDDYFLIDDRAEAIAFAVRLAQPGDVVITCGKGHERSMCFGTTEYPWSDQEAVERALNTSKSERQESK
jgi:UDP-N-acetylmuramoyl-L-alanyl-D-glutamate--2,6-diaminopimelate ligase